jgi:Na+/H+-dicarboxylate symporter
MGMAAARLPQAIRGDALAFADVAGTLWLNALYMTVIPLVVLLLVTGISRGAEAARAGGIAGRTVLWVVILCTASAVFGAFAILLLTATFPLPRASAASLQSALAAVEQVAPA